MSAFGSPLQPRPLTPVTLHRLAAGVAERMEEDLTGWLRTRPATLILPCHVRDAGGAAFRRIVREISGASWLRHIIVGLDGGTAADVDAARRLLAGMSQEVRILWTGATAVRDLEDRLGLPPRACGKGRNVWLCAGAALALAGKGVVAVQDSDIRNYAREMIVRLCWPVANPDAGFAFCKGFYRRHSAQLDGRVSRLLLRPLLLALERACGPVPVLRFVREFHYPLAGESAFDASLLRSLPMPPGWGLETGILLELSRAVGDVRYCQSELCDRYDHKHQDLSPADASQGLHAMAAAIIRTLLAGLRRADLAVDDAAAARILKEFDAECDRAIHAARTEAAMNGLVYHEDLEVLAVRTFGGALRAGLAGTGPGPEESLPSWNDVLAQHPGAAESILPDAI